MQVFTDLFFKGPMFFMEHILGMLDVKAKFLIVVNDLQCELVGRRII